MGSSWREIWGGLQGSPDPSLFQGSWTLLGHAPLGQARGELQHQRTPSSAGHSALLSVCSEIDQWPPPVPGQMLNLPVMGVVIQVWRGGLPARCCLAWPHSARRAALSREGGPLGALLLVAQVRIPSRGDKPGSCPPAKPLIQEVRESCLCILSGAHLPLDTPLRTGQTKRPDQALPRQNVKPFLPETLAAAPSKCV